MSNSDQHVETQENIPRESTSLFANADFFIGGALISPLVAMLVSACWWAIVDRQVFVRQYKWAGSNTGEYVWLWAVAVASSLFLVGAVVLLSGWFFRRASRGKNREIRDDQMPRWFALGNWISGLLLAPPLLTLVWVLTWTWVDTCRGVQRPPAALLLRYYDLRLFFGPAFSLGCTIALATRISLVWYSLRHAKVDLMLPPEKIPTLVKAGAAIGGLLVLPAVATVVVVCWDTLLARMIGVRPRGGLSGTSNVMFRMIVTLGPANFVGCTFLLWSGNEWLEYWCRQVRIGGVAQRQGRIKPSLLLFAKIDGAVGAMLMSPTLIVLGVSAWMAFRRTFGRFFDRDFRRLISGDLVSFYGPCIVAGSIVLVLSSVAWWFARSASVKVVDKAHVRGVPRLVKLGAIVGTMMLSPVPAMLLAMGWETLQERFYPEPHLSRVTSSAVYILEDASELFGGAVAVGVMFVALSALGLCMSTFIQSFQRKPLALMAQSFDDL